MAAAASAPPAASSPPERDDPAPKVQFEDGTKVRVPRIPIHLHREAHRRGHRTDAAVLEARDEAGADVVGLVSGPVEFEVRDGSRRPADRCLGHLDDDARQRARPRVVTEDLIVPRFELGPVDPDEPDVVRAAFQGECRQRPRAERPARADRPRPIPFAKTPDGRMVFELDWDTHLSGGTAPPGGMPRARQHPNRRWEHP